MVAEVCPASAGWRVAHAAELVAAGFDGGVRRFHNYYAGQAGWDGIMWGRVDLRYFVTTEVSHSSARIRFSSISRTRFEHAV